MDRTHYLASHSVNLSPQTGPATKAEIDTFYDDHGHDAFAHAYRFRRWLRAFAARPGKRAEARQGFAPMAPNR